jgi:hypothetical protein
MHISPLEIFSVTDKGLKTRWRWSLLSEKDKDGIDWREWCKKTDIAGMCFCIACSKTIRYGTTGKKSLRLHPTIGIDVFH